MSSGRSLRLVGECQESWAWPGRPLVHHSPEGKEHASQGITSGEPVEGSGQQVWQGPTKLRFPLPSQWRGHRYVQGEIVEDSHQVIWSLVIGCLERYIQIADCEVEDMSRRMVGRSVPDQGLAGNHQPNPVALL